jgi:hypothetical protein
MKGGAPIAKLTSPARLELRIGREMHLTYPLIFQQRPQSTQAHPKNPPFIPLFAKGDLGGFGLVAEVIFCYRATLTPQNLRLLNMCCLNGDRLISRMERYVARPFLCRLVVAKTE